MITPQVRPKLQLPGIFDEIIRTVIFVIVVTVLFDMAIPRSLIDGRSMQPGYQDGERLIVSRVHYLITKPQRGDVIVFNSVERPEQDMLIKRVIGMPGDTIEFRNSEVYINGDHLEEPYIQECVTSCPDETWQVPQGHYFVMGDNRDNSRDSRSFDPIPLESIVGQVIVRYWPLPQVGLIMKPDYD